MYFLAAKLARASCYGALNKAMSPRTRSDITVKYPKRYTDSGGAISAALFTSWRDRERCPLTHDTRAMVTHVDILRVLNLGDRDDSALANGRKADWKMMNRWIQRIHTAHM